MRTIHRAPTADLPTIFATSVLLVLPLAFLEWWSTGQPLARLPWSLFATLAALVAAALWLVRSGGAWRGQPTQWVRLALAVVVMAAVAGAVVDQMPCFLGVPNCD